MDKIFRLFDSICPLGDSVKDYILSTLKTRHFLKRELLLRAGHTCSHIWFVETGIVKCFYTKDQKDVVAWIMKENDIITSVESFLLQKVSMESIQTIEDTAVHYLHFDELQYIYRTFPEFNLHGRVITEKYYIASEQRLIAMRHQSAAERYLHLRDHHPDIIRRVSNTDIASYLGISLETLSRLKRDL